MSWFDPKVHALLIEAGVCEECRAASAVHKYSDSDIENARVFFYDKWLWDDDSKHNRQASELLEELLKNRKSTIDEDGTEWSDPYVTQGPTKIFI